MEIKIDKGDWREKRMKPLRKEHKIVIAIEKPRPSGLPKDWRNRIFKEAQDGR